MLSNILSYRAMLSNDYVHAAWHSSSQLERLAAMRNYSRLQLGLQRLTNDNYKRLRAEATEALAAISTPTTDSAVISTITKCLEDPSVLVRAAAVRASGYLSRRNQQLLNAFLNRSQAEEDEQIRAAVIRQLPTVGTGLETINRLLQVVENDKSEKVREDAARGLLVRSELERTARDQIVASLRDKLLSPGVRDVLKPLLQEVDK